MAASTSRGTPLARSRPDQRWGARCVRAQVRCKRQRTMDPAIRYFRHRSFRRDFGRRLGSLRHGVHHGAFSGQTNPGGGDAYVRKYDASGNELWTRQFGTSSTDRSWGISVNASGVYVTGFTWGTFSGQTSAGGHDVYLRKYDASGNELWTRQFGTSDTIFPTGISVNASGVYVTGYTYGAFSGQTNPGNYDAYVRSTMQAATNYGPGNSVLRSYDFSNGISVNASGVYVTGFTAGTFSARPALGMSMPTCVSTMQAATNYGPGNSVLLETILPRGFR